VVHVGGAVLAVVAVDALAYHNISMSCFDGLICGVGVCRRSRRLMVGSESTYQSRPCMCTFRGYHRPW
jgi:hypothetical protein